MGGYFNGWRRKMGLVTLVMACMFMTGWVRSLMVEDYVQIFYHHGIYFRNGSIERVANDGPGGQQRIWWSIPYWSLVIPPTLLSAYLLLSNPRHKTSPGTERAIIPPTSTGPDKDPAIASAPEVAADH